MTEESNLCPKCGEEFRLVWIGNDPPEPYGEMCGCPDLEFGDARDEKRASDHESIRFSAAQKKRAFDLIEPDLGPAMELEDIDALRRKHRMS